MVLYISQILYILAHGCHLCPPPWFSETEMVVAAHFLPSQVGWKLMVSQTLYVSLVFLWCFFYKVGQYRILLKKTTSKDSLKKYPK